MKLLKTILALVFISIFSANVFAQTSSTTISVATPPAPTLAIVGLTSNVPYSYGIVCHDHYGGVSHVGDFRTINNGPPSLGISNSIIISGWPIGCNSVDILKGSPYFAIAMGVVGTSFTDNGISPVNYNPASTNGSTMVIGNTVVNGTFNTLVVSNIVNSDISIDASVASRQTALLNASANLNLANLAAGPLSLDIIENATGGFTPSFIVPSGSNLVWSNNVTPSISTTPNAHNLYQFTAEGTTIIGALLGSSSGGGGGGSGTVNSGSSGQLAYYSGNGNVVGGTTVNGDCTFNTPSTFTCTKTNGNAFAASATTDTTNASNISSGVLNATHMPLGLTSAPAAGQFPVGNIGGTAYVNRNINGDATLDSAGALTVTKTNGNAFAASATTNALNASNISSGTLGNARMPTPYGASTYTSHGLLTGAGTSNIGSIPVGTSGQVLLGQTNADAQFNPMSGDAVINNSGAITVTKTNGTGFAASATTNALNAANINSGTLPSARMPLGLTAAPASGQLPVGNSGGTFYANQNISGDATLAPSGALTVTKTNGSSFGALATASAPLSLANGGNACAGNILVSQLPSPGVPGTQCYVTDAINCIVGQTITGSGNINSGPCWATNTAANVWVAAQNAAPALPLSPDVSCTNQDPTQCPVVGLEGIPLSGALAANQVYASNSTATALVGRAFCSPPTTIGDLIIGQLSGCPIFLHDVALDQILMAGGTNASPAYVALVNCASDGSHALTYSTSTHSWACTSITATGITAAIAGFTRSTLSGNFTTSGTANTPTNLFTQNLTMPSSGCGSNLWRVLADWVACTGTPTITTTYQVVDGSSNTWADREIGSNLGTNTCSGGSGYSPVTYANGASVAINLSVASSGTSSTISQTSTANGQTKTTYLQTAVQCAAN